MNEPTCPAEVARQQAEARADVYDDEQDACLYCDDSDPCCCDAIYDSWKDREFDDL